ncbi:MAG TPA: glucosamine-6-phosphate deaminase [Solirubrobacteraceae bacterium]|jgi:glucosamine-6-phosphate deaminase|nr:glucosamine-6-phosphate deaminase [Solirubrobacteraceae bacterium]
MKVLIVPDEDTGAVLAADLIRELVDELPNAILGFATGSTPEPLYAELAARSDRGLDLRGVHGFLLDEYVGLAAGHPQSYRQVIRREVSDRLGLDAAQISGPDGSALDLHSAARRYEQEICTVGGVDLQILGLGGNGHIGFNEPGSPFNSRTRVVTLTEQTRTDNARFFGGKVDSVPTHAITQGLATISSARRLVLLAWGEHKAEAAAQSIEGEMTERWPATMLQMHPDVTMILDHAAATLLHDTGIASLGSMHEIPDAGSCSRV